jgi:hypothetical protein
MNTQRVNKLGVASRTVLVLILLLIDASLVSCGHRSFAPSPEALQQGRDRRDQTVILLHGLGRTANSMATLGKRLADAGYRVEAWGYPSMFRTIQGHADWFDRRLNELMQDPSVRQVHFVTHSLGGIITRQWLLENRPPKLGRVVMLAPPHQGSAWARYTWPLCFCFCRPMRQLSSASDSYVNRMGAPVGVPIGIIAGKRDTKSTVERTHMPGETDHVVVPGGHTWIMNRDDVLRHVLHFLKHGRFADSATSAAATQ